MFPHLQENAFDHSLEEIDPAVGEDRSNKAGDFDVAEITVAVRELDRIAFDAGGVIACSIKGIESFFQRRPLPAADAGSGPGCIGHASGFYLDMRIEDRQLFSQCLSIEGFFLSRPDYHAPESFGCSFMR